MHVRVAEGVVEEDMGTQAMMFEPQPAFVYSDESVLVARARQRDTQAFTDLVNQHYRRIYRLAKRIIQNDQDAEDVLQETFLKAYEHLDSFQGNSRFCTWIVRIAMNEALMKLRKRRNHLVVSLDDPIDPMKEVAKREVAVGDEDPEQQYSRSEMYRILDHAMKSLSPRYRIVFLLRDVEEFSIAETAETLGISIPAVKSRQLRARLALREKLNRRFKSRRAEPVILLKCLQARSKFAP